MLKYYTLFIDVIGGCRSRFTEVHSHFTGLALDVLRLQFIPRVDKRMFFHHH